jgi:hypothetical protein
VLLSLNQPVIAASISSKVWPRSRFFFASWTVAGVIVSVASAILLWLPTYPNLAPVPGSSDVVHLIPTPYLLLWVTGALAPLLVFVRPKYWGWFCSVTLVAAATVIGFVVSITLMPPPTSYSLAISGVILFSLLLVLGFTIELIGTSLWRATIVKGQAVHSGSD